MGPVYIRVAAVLSYEDMVLLVQSEDSIKGNYWVLPGGTLEQGETAEECLRRELKEELNIEISNPKLLFVGDNLDKNNFKNHHLLELYYKAEFIGKPQVKNEIIKCRFFHEQEMEGIDFRPKGITPLIFKKEEKGYIGNLFTPI